MSTEKSLLISVTPEPPEFHEKSAKQSCVSLHLAFNGKQEEVEIRLQKSDWRFLIHRLEMESGVLVAKPDDNITIDKEWLSPREEVHGESLTQWLKEHRGFDNSAAPLSVDELENDVDPERAAAFQLLLGTASWTAPVVHAVQLMRIVRLEAAAGTDTANLILLPETDSTIDDVQRQGSNVTLKLTGGEFDGYSVITNELSWTFDEDLPTTLEEAVEKTFPVPVRSDGFLYKVHSEEDYRFLQAFEPAAANLFWSLSALLDTDDELIEAISPELLASLGCALALDPLWLSLMSPGIPENQDHEGALLAPLIRLYEQNPTDKKPLVWLRQQLETIASDQLPGILGDLHPANAANGAKQTNATVLQKLRSLMSHLQEEAGLEDVLGRILNHIITKTGGDDELHDLLNAYRQELNNAFNALEAVRLDCGQLLVRWLTDEWREQSSEELFELVLAAQPYSQRLDKNALENSWSKVFVASLIKLDTELEDTNGVLSVAWEAAVLQALGGAISKSPRRFVPDRSLQPLPIPIAANASGDHLDRFTESFNGVAVLLRKATSDDWAHANLVSLYPLEMDDEREDEQDGKKLRYREKWGPGRFAIQSFLPVSVDGRREMFLQYHGVPLASPAYSATGGPGLPPEMPDEQRRPFYIFKDADFDGSKYMKPPRIAYASSYESFAVAISKGGALPELMQHQKFPWLPKHDLDLTGVELKDFVTITRLKRRTAIGATAYGASESMPSRIDVQYPDVYPLSLDFPRCGLFAANGGTDTLDLFRRTDGIGLLLPPTESTATHFSLRANRVILSSGLDATEIAIEVHSDATATLDAKPLAAVVLDGDSLQLLLNRDWNFEIVSEDSALHSPPAESNQLQLKLGAPIPPNTTLWIRLKLTSTADSLAWSFSQLEASDDGDLGSENQSPTPHLLVGDHPSLWDETFTGVTEIDCVLSRTIWSDWERWCNNPQLEINGRPHPPKAVNNAVEAFVDASLMRGEDHSGEMSRLIDRLPDPCVCGFLVELAQIDRIETRETSDWAVAPIELPAPDWLDIDAPEDPENNATAPTEEDYEEYFGELQEYLTKVDRRFRLKMHFSSSKASLKGNSNKVFVSVPAGSVGKISVRPLVDKAYFEDSSDAPFGEEMVQLASGTYHFDGKDCYVFPGAELLVESMFNAPWLDTEAKPRQNQYENILADSLSVDCTNDLRTYRLMQVAPQVDQPEPMARCFANVEIRTQRWRFSGRPIYHWISPKLFNKSGTNVVMELDPNIQGKTTPEDLFDFESQLFFDRDDADCEVQRVRLFGSGTELANYSWEQPSATYFRHAFGLISRYSGAMSGAADRLWPRHLPAWSRRCAVLANSNRLDITRPQVRCLIPLSQDPVGVSPKGTPPEVVEWSFPRLTPMVPSPPLACVVEERPLEMGGLAERLLSELVTGVGYGFEPNEVAVQPIDTGKEVSRDPRLDSRSWKHDLVQGKFETSHMFVLEPEGPVGLHFEESNVPAPSWSNCQYMLKPRTIDGKHLPDESFVGVRLRRMLDPAWVVGSEVDMQAEQKLALYLSWQAAYVNIPLDPDAAPARVDLMTLSPETGQPTKLLRLEVTDHYAVFYFNRQLVAENYQPGDIVLCALPVKDVIRDLRLLHTSYADGKYSLSVLANLGDNSNEQTVIAGSSNFPSLLASVDWRSDTTPELSEQTLQLCFVQDSKLGSSGPEVSQLTTSSPTVREWGRTAKNSDWVHCLSDSQCKTIAVHDLSATMERSSKVTSLSFLNKDLQPEWLVSSLADSRQPLSIQRHLVGVFTRRSGGSGKQFDLYSYACMLNGNKTELCDLIDQDARRVDLYELEVPATIVAAGVSLEEFKHAHIDLISTGAATVSTGGVITRANERTYRLHVRFANSSLSMATSNGLKIFLTVPNRGNSENPFELLKVECPNEVRAVDICFDDTGARCRFHLSDGGFSVKDALDVELGHLQHADSLQVALEAPSSLGEVWADVSVLHSEPTTNGKFDLNHFDFDWLFSHEHTESTRSTRVSSTKLGSLAEAQARLVSASPSIEILNKTN